MVRLYKIGFKNIYIYNAHRCSRTRTKKCRRRTWRASRDTRTHLRRQRKSQCDSHFDTSGLSSTAKCSSTLRWRTARIENARFTNKTRQNTKNDKKQRLLLATAQRTALEHASPPPLPANSFRAHRASSQSGKQRQGLPTRHAACAYCCNCAKKKPQQHKPKQKPLKTKHTKQHADNRKTKHSASIGGTACRPTQATPQQTCRAATQHDALTSVQFTAFATVVELSVVVVVLLVSIVAVVAVVVVVVSFAVCAPVSKRCAKKHNIVQNVVASRPQREPRSRSPSSDDDDDDETRDDAERNDGRGRHDGRSTVQVGRHGGRTSVFAIRLGVV